MSLLPYLSKSITSLSIAFLLAVNNPYIHLMPIDFKLMFIASLLSFIVSSVILEAKVWSEKYREMNFVYLFFPLIRLICNMTFSFVWFGFFIHLTTEIIWVPYFHFFLSVLTLINFILWSFDILYLLFITL